VLQQRDLEVTAKVLTDWLAQKVPSATDVAVSDLTVPRAGASNETILFTASWTDDATRHESELVLRVEPATNQLFLVTDVFFQWQMMAGVARSSDIPVPNLRWPEPDAHVLGAPFFIMDRVPGEVPNGHNSPLMEQSTPEQRRSLYANGLAALASIHQIDWRTEFGFLLPDLGPPGLASHLGKVERWYEWARDGRRFDHIEKALGFLRDAMPAAAEISLIWGDSRLGNVIFDPEDQRVTAVLDWELADIATPQVDLAWWLMFERLFTDRGTAAPEGVLSREETLAVFESGLGRPLRDLCFYDVLAWTRLAITFVRHVDVEKGSPQEAMYTELDGYVGGVLRSLVEGKDY
jgi:aminoglycoside phosphotransferase (APT) family kinase protein